MPYRHLIPLTLAACLCATTGCTQSTPSAASASPGKPLAAAPADSVCDRKLITPQDVAGLLDQPVAKVKNIPGDPQSCEFSTAGFLSLTISVRPGQGVASVGMYTSGKMDQYEKSVPLAGVGDAAVRSLSLNRIVARKGDLLCEITGPGLAKDGDDPGTLKLGELCNKVFAAY
ncbi:MAG: hypothetical protein ACYC7G_01535 [Rudaea sp.]